MGLGSCSLRERGCREGWVPVHRRLGKQQKNEETEAGQGSGVECDRGEGAVGRGAGGEERVLLKDEEVVSKSPGYSWDRRDHLVLSELLVPAPSTGEQGQAQKGPREGEDPAPLRDPRTRHTCSVQL